MGGSFGGELEAMGVVKVMHIDTHDNAADVLTKWLPSESFRRHSDFLLNVDDVSRKTQ